MPTAGAGSPMVVDAPESLWAPDAPL